MSKRKGVFVQPSASGRAACNKHAHVSLPTELNKAIGQLWVA